MTANRRRIIVTASVTVAAVFVTATLFFASGREAESVKLEGGLVATVVNFQGIPGRYPFHWSYDLVPSPSGRSAALHGSIDVGFPQNPLLPFDFHSPFIGEIVLSGPDRADFDPH